MRVSAASEPTNPWDQNPAPPHRIAPAEAIPEAELEQAPHDLPPAGRRPSRFMTHLVLSTGGLLGANARYAFGQWATTHWGDSFPWGTLAINLIGCYLLGLYLTLVTERFTGRSPTRLFLATGFLGAFTTFSTFSYEVVTLFRHGSVLPGIGYLAVSLVIGLVAVIAGIVSAHAL